MGRNNRARRQQKQRQKQSKQKKTTSRSQKGGIPLDELLTLFEPVTISLTNGEPPPPSVMESWTDYPASAAGKPLRSLLIGFINFLFHGDEAMGDLAQLVPHRRQMKQADLAWLYPVLYAYCLMSEQTLAQGELDTLALAVNDEGIPCDTTISNQSIEELCAPFYLLLWVMGRPVENAGHFRSWLRDWLGDSPLYSLLPPLQKFLELKQPKPEQKTVKTLETALANIELREHEEWRDGLRLLITVFLQQRLSAAQSQPERWQQCPQLSRLGGLVDTPILPTWSQLTFSEANTATLNRLNRLVDTALMPYTERLSLEALKCRLFSRYANAGEVGEDDFERQLEHVIHLMSVRVPTDHHAFAERCLDMTCEWLAQEVGNGRLRPPSAARLRRLSRLRPDDYRVALLTYLASGGRKAEAKNTDSVNFQHIHFPLFFRALDEDFSRPTILDRFYWPLTGEAKKALFNQCCQKLFLSMNEFEAEGFWTRWRQPLFDVTQAPFNAIVKGQACESDMLFYTTIAAVDTGYGTDWLQTEQIASLIRTAEQLLNKHDSDFNQERVVGLLNSLTTHPDAASLFQFWEQVINLVHKVEFVDEIEIFLRFALESLHHQTDNAMAHQETLYSICRSFPALRQYLPSKKSSRPTKKAKNPKKTQKPKKPVTKTKTAKPPPEPSPNLDLFGDL
jgi:hypothetical protein